MRNTSTDQIAMAISDPSSLLPRGENETVARWSTRAVEAVLKDERSFGAMYERAYFDIQKALDEYLGSDWEDGAGQGIVADVYLLGHRYELAIKALRAAGAGAIADAIRSQQMPDPFDQPETDTRPNPPGGVA